MTAIVGTARATPSSERFLARHALATYFLLTFAISWGSDLLVVGPVPSTADSVERLLRQQLSDGDLLFAVLREFRPVRRDPLVVIQPTPRMRERQRHRRQALSGRPDERHGVLLPRLARLTVAYAAPQVDDLLTIPVSAARATAPRSPMWSTSSGSRRPSCRSRLRKPARAAAHALCARCESRRVHSSCARPPCRGNGVAACGFQRGLTVVGGINAVIHPGAAAETRRVITRDEYRVAVMRLARWAVPVDRHKERFRQRTGEDVEVHEIGIGGKLRVDAGARVEDAHIGEGALRAGTCEKDDVVAAPRELPAEPPHDAFGTTVLHRRKLLLVDEYDSHGVQFWTRRSARQQ
jgi:hypothetical protein